LGLLIILMAAFSFTDFGGFPGTSLSLFGFPVENWGVFYSGLLIRGRLPFPSHRSFITLDSTLHTSPFLALDRAVHRQASSSHHSYQLASFLSTGLTTGTRVTLLSGTYLTPSTGLSTFSFFKGCRFKGCRLDTPVLHLFCAFMCMCMQLMLLNCLSCFYVLKGCVIPMAGMPVPRGCDHSFLTTIS